MLFPLHSHRSGSVRSAKAPVNTICSQCGSVLPDHSGHCPYCDPSSDETLSRAHSAGAAFAAASPRRVPPDSSVDPAWRNELASRLAAYRTRRRRPAPNDAQSDLPFEAAAPAAVALADSPLLDLPPSSGAAPQSEEFAFTIAIGRLAKPAMDSSDLPGEPDPSHMEIDVSLPSSLPGLDAPDTRNAIKVPPLNEPERPRVPGDPCLSQPPSFKS